METTQAEIMGLHDAIPITPPEGTNLYVLRSRTNTEGTPGEYRYGLENIYRVVVSELKPEPENIGKTVVGTLLGFQPGSVMVEVTRRNLTGQEINRMGELAREIDDNARVQAYVANVSKATRELGAGLKLFAGATTESGVEYGTEELARKVTEKIEATSGVDADSLDAKAAELKEKFNAMVMEAKGMGVNLIHTQTGATPDGAFPIALYPSPNPTEQ